MHLVGLRLKVHAMHLLVFGGVGVPSSLRLQRQRAEGVWHEPIYFPALWNSGWLASEHGKHPGRSAMGLCRKGLKPGPWDREKRENQQNIIYYTLLYSTLLYSILYYTTPQPNTRFRWRPEVDSHAPASAQGSPPYLNGKWQPKMRNPCLLHCDPRPGLWERGPSAQHHPTSHDPGPPVFSVFSRKHGP